MSRPAWVPDDVALDQPSAARMYDYYLGGSHNFAIDRRMAKQAMAMWPDLPLIMQANRAFLRRAVRFLVARGIQQFLDIGSGIPTVGNVHEVAQQANPAARVVYVDIDPVAVAHSQVILDANPDAAVIQADARRPEHILTHPTVHRLLDFQQPVAVLLVALLHFIVDDAEVRDLIRRLHAALPSGSYLAMTHASYEGKPRESQEHQRLYARTSTPMTMRARDEIAGFFDRFEVVEPGIVYIPLWRPEGPDDVLLDQPERCTGFAGVGYKP